MRHFSFFLLLVPAFAVTGLYAQNNSIGSSLMITTTSEGNVAWSANVDGQSRKGYLDKKTDAALCNQATVDEDVIIPTTTYLYPFQSTDLLFLSGNGVDTYSVTILDEEGHIMASKESNEDQSIDISSYRNGTYTLHIQRGAYGKMYTKKIVKE